MTKEQGFRVALRERPRNFFQLDATTQWGIDKSVGILDWEGGNFSPAQMDEWNAYFNIKSSTDAKESTYTLQEAKPEGEDNRDSNPSNTDTKPVDAVKQQIYSHTPRDNKGTAKAGKPE
jgi:hypothetical protein